MIRRPPRSTLSSSSAASDVYKRQDIYSTIVRGAVWTPQGGGSAPAITPPEGAIDTVSYGYINGAGRYYSCLLYTSPSPRD